MSDTNKVLLFHTGKIGTGAYNHAENGQHVACIANIGPAERRHRMRFGLTGLALGALLGAGMIALGIDPLWRLALFLPFSAGASGYFQARDKT